MRTLTVLSVLVWWVVITPTSAFTAQIEMADIYLTPQGDPSIVGGYLGGDGKVNPVNDWIDWSIGNKVPFSTATTNDMVVSTCVGDFMNPAHWVERMRVTKQGRVGIGTTTPRTRLELTGGNRLTIEGWSGDFMTQTLVFLPSELGTQKHHFFIGAPSTDGNGDLYFGQTKEMDATTSANYSAYIDGSTNQWSFFGSVGIGLRGPSEKLHVAGKVKAQAFIVGDITFEKDGKALWRMFEDEKGLYLQSVNTGKVFRFMVQEVNDK